MGRAVLLIHRLPDGTEHFDWMIQRPGGAHAPLLSFRVFDRIDRGAITTFHAEAIGDHRPAYLEYEGPVGGERGTVHRLARGELELLRYSHEAVVLRGWLGSARGEFHGRACGPERWTFHFIPAADTAPAAQ